MPSLEKPWTTEQRLKFATILASMDAEELPRFESPRSGAAFARLTERGTMNRFLDKRVAIKDRAEQLTNEMAPRLLLNRVYLRAFAAAGVGTPEALEMQAVTTQEMGIFVQVSDEYFATIPKDDPKYARRLAGRDKMLNGVRQMVLGNVLNVVTDDQPYAIKDRKRFIAHLQKDLPRLFFALPLRDRARMLGHLTGAIDRPHMTECRPELISLIEVLKQGPK